MAFEKDYPNRKDWRKQYKRGWQRFDTSCRCNGRCDYCRDNRLYSVNKGKQRVDDLMDEFLDKDNEHPLIEHQFYGDLWYLYSYDIRED